MKRLATRLSFVLAALAATPAALAGSEILKCVDAAGHVTLTDQPCQGGSHGTRLVSNAAPDTAPGEPSTTGAQPQTQANSVQRYEAPQAMLRYQDWRPRVPNRDRPLARDIATLKAARAQLMLSDAVRQPRPQLAAIQ